MITSISFLTPEKTRSVALGSFIQDRDATQELTAEVFAVDIQVLDEVGNIGYKRIEGAELDALKQNHATLYAMLGTIKEQNDRNDKDKKTEINPAPLSNPEPERER